MAAAWWRLLDATHRGREGGGIPGPRGGSLGVGSDHRLVQRDAGVRFDVSGDVTAVSLAIEDGRITRIFAIETLTSSEGWKQVAELRR